MILLRQLELNIETTEILSSNVSSSDLDWFMWFRLNRRCLVAKIFGNQFY